MIVVVPAAGLSTRFDDGDPTPKQFRWWDDAQMWQHAIRDVIAYGHVVLVVRNEHRIKYGPFGLADDTVVLDSRGQAESVLHGLWETGPGEDEVLVVNCDSGWARGVLSEVVEAGRKVGIPTAAVIRVTPEDGVRWSYVNWMPFFQFAAERQPISEYALAGAYYFPSKRALLSALLAITDGGGEPYLSSVYEQMPGGAAAYLIERHYWRDWGTAERWREDLARGPR